MSDLLQVVIVTVVAGLALGALIWSHVRRSPAPPPCANCGLAGRRPVSAGRSKLS